MPLLKGKRVVVTDDTISSGTTALAALDLMVLAGAEVVGLSFAMSQGELWRAALAARGPHWPGKVSFVFQSPHLTLTDEGWVPV